MSLSKRFLKHPATQSAAAFLLSLYIRFTYYTNLKTFRIHPEAQALMEGTDNGIFAFWHGRLMMMPTINPPRKMHVLISQHRDGLLISQVISHFNQDTIVGSSSKGGSEAVRNIVRLLKSGCNVSITPDGPRGPNQAASAGIVTVARLSQKAILPITYSCSRHKRTRSWDRFMVALPFGRMVFCVGAPIVVKEADEAARLQVERAMNELVEQADAL